MAQLLCFGGLSVVFKVVPFSAVLGASAAGGGCALII